MNVLLLTGKYQMEELVEIKDVKTGLKAAKERASKIMVYL
jgi:hypothetical protein